MTAQDSTTGSPGTTAVTRRAALGGLAVLTLINLLNYLDRYVLAALLPQIKSSGLSLSDFELGTLMTGFIIVYLLAAPLFGSLGDRGRRPRLVAIGVTLWSLATAASGLARSYLQLFSARAAVGVGEAAYGTIAPALLADYFPRGSRGRAFAVFYMAIPVGSALGYVFGGLAAQAWGWRTAFLLAGLPGLALAVCLRRLVDPPRGVQEPGLAAAPAAGGVAATWALYRALLRRAPYTLTVLGYAAYTFAMGGLAFWMPTFLMRARGLPAAQATTTFGVVVVVTGFLGTFAGGWLGDLWQKRSQQAYLWLCGVVTLLAVPVAAVALMAAARAVYYPALIVAELLLFMSTGPVNSAIVNLVAPAQRASAVGLSVFAIHALGDVLSPSLIGALSDHWSLGVAVLVVPVAVAISGLLWLAAAAAARGAPAADARPATR